MRSNQMLPVVGRRTTWRSSACPLAYFEQYTLRRASRLVSWVIRCRTPAWSGCGRRAPQVGISSASPSMRRLVISRRNTPDFVNGSRNRDGLVRPDVRAVVVVRPRLGQRVEHLVRELGRREDLVVREVRDARQHVRVAALRSAKRAPGSSRRAPRTVIGGYVLRRREDLVLLEIARRACPRPRTRCVRVSKRKSRRWNLPLPR